MQYSVLGQIEQKIMLQGIFRKDTKYQSSMITTMLMCECLDEVYIMKINLKRFLIHGNNVYMKFNVTARLEQKIMLQRIRNKRQYQSFVIAIMQMCKRLDRVNNDENNFNGIINLDFKNVYMYIQYKVLV